MLDLLGSLKKLVEWQRVVAAADKVSELERRLAALEARTQAAPQFATCPSCGVGRWHKQRSAKNLQMGDLGVVDITWGCSNCAYTEVKTET
jgi:hypothetical protein